MHSSFIRAALDEAKRFRGYCAPNPSVGAVAVKNQQIIARAAHQGAGTAHAEINLLDQLEGDLSGITIYVTLEPCNHWGKTPPCVKKLIERRVGRVVYAFSDPNPLVKQNNTPKILREAGVETHFHPVKEVDQFYRSYQYWMQCQRPWVTAKMAISLNGKIAFPGGQPCQLSNDLCRHFTHQQRGQSDVILTTATTLLTDNPRLTVRLNQQEIGKPLAIVDRNLKVSGEQRAVQAAKSMIQFHQPGVMGSPLPMSERVEIPVCDDRLNMEEVLGYLGKKGYHDVWIEAGGKLFAYLHQHDLVQTTYVYLTPHILNSQAVPAFPEMPDWQEKKPVVAWESKNENAVLRLEWPHANIMSEL